jgi:hypothetical protein
MLFSNVFKRFDPSSVCIETLLFLSRNTDFQVGVVADDMSLNATSVHKAVTECHFFVKTVKSL